ncbi:MAG: Ig-like domain-containing protein, partial [Chloroflexi bacterium]|nr:Ig-like domain-containing protein [Chloroflexota bacterium]
MRTRSMAIGGLIMLATCLSVLACDLGALPSLGLGGSSKPQVTIQAPAAGSQFHEGDDVPVQSVSTDPNGIVRVELSVDGSVARTDSPPISQGQTSFSVIQTWKATSGNHTLSVRAYDAAGAASDPALVAITVTASSASIPSPTLSGIPPLGGTPVNPATLLTPTLGPTETTPIAPAATRTRAATPTISAPPGVWAVSIRVDPADPKNNNPVKFWVTFLNTTGN